MEYVTNPLADFEQCTVCRGLWLDMLEDKDLREVADAIDTGDPQLGRRYNDKVDVYCPVCSNSRMLRMVAAGQPHIWFEQCSTCKGRFYDAGEFKDASHKTLGDFFRSLFATERK
jgi:Zn-finger nucleic acid-binding protein